MHDFSILPVTCTLALACFSTLTVNEFITHFLSLCQICPKRFSIMNCFFRSSLLQDIGALGPSVLLACDMSSSKTFLGLFGSVISILYGGYIVSTLCFVPVSGA